MKIIEMKAREFKMGENLDVIHAPLIGSYKPYSWWMSTTDSPIFLSKE